MIKETEERLGVSFYSQIKLFYKNYNGLKVKEPAVEIFPLEKLIKHDGAILFATVNNNQKLYFDIAEGSNKAHPEWRMPVYGAAKAAAAE